ncbi:MAG: hypothetical protein ACE5J7_01140 [Candidatus Aenigmatarchaeota archaeon]
MEEAVGPPCPKCGRPTTMVVEQDGTRAVRRCSGCMKAVEACTCIPEIRMAAKEPVETPEVEGAPPGP